MCRVVNQGLGLGELVLEIGCVRLGLRVGLGMLILGIGYVRFRDCVEIWDWVCQL